MEAERHLQWHGQLPLQGSVAVAALLLMVLGLAYVVVGHLPCLQSLHQHQPQVLLNSSASLQASKSVLGLICISALLDHTSIQAQCSIVETVHLHWRPCQQCCPSARYPEDRELMRQDRVFGVPLRLHRSEEA